MYLKLNMNKEHSCFPNNLINISDPERFIILLTVNKVHVKINKSTICVQCSSVTEFLHAGHCNDVDNSNNNGVNMNKAVIKILKTFIFKKKKW